MEQIVCQREEETVGANYACYREGENHACQTERPKLAKFATKPMVLWNSAYSLTTYASAGKKLFAVLFADQIQHTLNSCNIKQQPQVRIQPFNVLATMEHAINCTKRYLDYRSNKHKQILSLEITFFNYMYMDICSKPKLCMANRYRHPFFCNSDILDTKSRSQRTSYVNKLCSLN